MKFKLAHLVETMESMATSENTQVIHKLTEVTHSFSTVIVTVEIDVATAAELSLSVHKLIICMWCITIKNV